MDSGSVRSRIPYRVGLGRWDDISSLIQAINKDWHGLLYKPSSSFKES